MNVFFLWSFNISWSASVRLINERWDHSSARILASQAVWSKETVAIAVLGNHVWPSLLTQAAPTDYEQLCALGVLYLADTQENDPQAVYEEYKEQLQRNQSLGMKRKCRGRELNQLSELKKLANSKEAICTKNTTTSSKRNLHLQSLYSLWRRLTLKT